LLFQGRDHLLHAPMFATRGQDFETFFLRTPLQNVDVDIPDTPVSDFRPAGLIKINRVGTDQGVPIIVDDVLFVRVNEPKARSERVSRPIRSSTQHLPTGKISADGVVSPASSLMLGVGSGAHLWNAPTTGQCRCRFRLRRAAYDKAS